MERNESTLDVILILQKYRNNITARRWLNNPDAIDQILDNHKSWNEDHIKTGHPEMVLTLEENIHDYLSFPEKIEHFLD